MARSRNIKPGFFLNPELNGCSPHARLLFIGLWLLADREGRLPDRPQHIKIQIFPSEAVDVDALLDELHVRKFAIRYEALGIRYVWLPTFTRHQNPHRNEVASIIPPFEPTLSLERALAPRYEAIPTKDSTAPAFPFPESISLSSTPSMSLDERGRVICPEIVLPKIRDEDKPPKPADQAKAALAAAIKPKVKDAEDLRKYGLGKAS